MSPPKVVVVGGGIGGISAAIQLAKAGFAVELLEKNAHLGGKLNLLERDGFRFDLGPSIFTLPQYFRPLFEGDGKRLEDYVPLRRLDPQWRNFFEDGTCFDLWEDEGRMGHELERLRPGLAQEFARFREYASAQYESVERGYFARGLDTFMDFVRFYGVKGAGDLDFLHSMTGGIEQRISEPHLRDALGYFIKYVGSSADRAPGFMNLMPAIQLDFGLWYVDGGLYRLAEALAERAREVGVRVRLETEVLEIEKGGHSVTGVTFRDATGETGRLAADYVVSNMEVIPAYRRLLREPGSFLRKFRRFEPACSGIVLHLGVKKRYPELAHHNFFYSRDQRAHFHRVFREHRLPDDPTIYLVAPSRTDPSQAPEGCENLKILPHVPYLQEENGYTREDCVALKERVLDKLERMGLTGLRENTIVEDFWTPFDIEARYYSNQGSIYGVVSDRFKNLAFKAPKRSSRYRNLYFVGGSVNPGGGMPMVALSGQRVAEMIEREEGG